MLHVHPQFLETTNGHQAKAFRPGPSPWNIACQNSLDDRDRPELKHRHSLHASQECHNQHRNRGRLCGAPASGNPQQSESNIKKNAAPFNFHRKTPGAALVISLRRATVQADHPIMQRTGHRSTMHDALTKWSTLVWAAITQCKNVIARGAENRDVTGCGFYNARTFLRDF